MIKVKYNIDFGKALKVINEQSLKKYVNEHFATRTAELSKKYIESGKVEPKLPKTNPRGTKSKPLFDTGKLANSLKGSSKGVTGIAYAAQHRNFLKTKNGVKIAYEWNKNSKTLDVPQREYLVHYKKYDENDKNSLALKGTGGDLVKMYKDFKKKFIRLLNKRMRK